ncbi:hypothetical protein ACFPRL_06095 [Pseudoclavibacter helvolus]
MLLDARPVDFSVVRHRGYERDQHLAERVVLFHHVSQATSTR